MKDWYGKRLSTMDEFWEKHGKEKGLEILRRIRWFACSLSLSNDELNNLLEYKFLGYKKWLQSQEE